MNKEFTELVNFKRIVRELLDVTIKKYNCELGSYKILKTYCKCIRRSNFPPFCPSHSDCDEICRCICSNCNGYKKTSGFSPMSTCKCDSKEPVLVETEEGNMCDLCASWADDAYYIAERIMTESCEEIPSSNDVVINITVAKISPIFFAVLHDKIDAIKRYLPSSDRSQKYQAFSIAYKLRKFDICAIFLENDLSFFHVIEQTKGAGKMKFLVNLFIDLVCLKKIDINAIIINEKTILDLFVVNLFFMKERRYEKLVKNLIGKLVSHNANLSILIATEDESIKLDIFDFKWYRINYQYIADLFTRLYMNTYKYPELSKYPFNGFNTMQITDLKYIVCNAILWQYQHLFFNCRHETDVRHPMNLCFNNSDLRNIIFEYAGLLML